MNSDTSCRSSRWPSRILRRVQPPERSSPKLLQALVRSCILKQMHIIMRAVEDEHEYL